MIKRNFICIKNAEYVLLIHKNLNVIQKMVYFLHFFQKGLLLAKSVNKADFAQKSVFSGPIPKTKPQEYQSEILHGLLLAQKE